jgi:hypothetical protein
VDDAGEQLPTATNDIAVTVDETVPRRVALTVENDGDPVSRRLTGYEATQLAGELVRAAAKAVPPRNNSALTTDEFAQMVRLMRRYAVSEMDQWDLFSVTTKYGQLYITLSLAVPDPSIYNSLDAWLAVPEDPS